MISSALDSSLSRLNSICDGINTLCARLSGLILVEVLIPRLNFVIIVCLIMILSLNLNMILNSTLAVL